MPCAVAVVQNSPIFSPTKKVPSIFYKPPATSSPKFFQVVHGPQLMPSPKTASASSSSSPLGGRFQRSIATPLTLSSTPTRESYSSSSSSAVLKRKRPGRIDIPAAAMNFAAVGSPTCGGVERIDVLEAEEDGYSVYCKRGRRGLMEDRYSAFVDLQSESRQAFFGVFDGHGGSRAAEFAAKNLSANISCESMTGGDDEIAEAVKTGYLKTDADFLKQDVSGGACCITALIKKDSLVVSNAGDCRAVMSRGGVAEALTTDHRPSRDDEKKRIETLGGYVDCRNGVWRIHGSLAVSRGIGDRNLKQWVTAEPETKVLRIEPECEFLILGSDGLWDKVNNQEAVDLVRPLCVGVDKPEPFSACKRLVDLSLRRGSTDDISVVIVQLSHFISSGSDKTKMSMPI